jgi:hypothetical protein
MHTAKREVLDPVESFNLNLLQMAELLKLSVKSRGWGASSASSILIVHEISNRG